MGSFTISIRDYRPLEDALRSGKIMKLDAQCTHNSNVIREILRYAPRVLPQFGSLSDGEVRQIADSVAYLMRTDIIKAGAFAFGPMPFQGNPKRSKVSGTVHIRAEVEALSPDFEIPYENNPRANMAGELFRCYVATQTWMSLTERLDPKHRSLAPSFKLADLTAHLIETDDLVDYVYTAEEIAQYRKALSGELRDV
ncbi:MAG: hypothetical protein KGH59_02455 [Candidatus Micrarchaeota archaeon]|nr:hypothetical protein [Candidatus Micrarchaeota archaeon]MDE1804618.1 hypothetical protein [Candidatus Micrarchaeota archaeon]MDE1846466.1 hypothetical protein [Candidatus Micrarchaeota archaeon]